jgi:hypothetical protein
MLTSRSPRLARTIVLGGIACLAGCSAVPSTRNAESALPAPAPWGGPPLAPADVPSIYRSVWRTAANRGRCALLAPARLDPRLQERAVPRAATFSGGWAVAYDLPGERSAFGIAGTGSDAWTDDVYDEWPRKRVLDDGSRVGYGPEGGTGPNWLAYLRIPGQQCLYNVWSRRGEAHLEELLGQLRFVADEGR